VTPQEMLSLGRGNPKKTKGGRIKLYIKENEETNQFKRGGDVCPNSRNGFGSGRGGKMGAEYWGKATPFREVMYLKRCKRWQSRVVAARKRERLQGEGNM